MIENGVKYNTPIYYYMVDDVSGIETEEERERVTSIFASHDSFVRHLEYARIEHNEK